MKLNSYKDLTVWQKAMTLVAEVYVLTQTLPTSEKFGLISQMQRAAIAIPSNLAEGYGRQHRKEFLQFIAIAQGSACELETQLLICQNVFKDHKLNCNPSLTQIDEVKRMLYALSKSLNS